MDPLYFSINQVIVANTILSYLSYPITHTAMVVSNSNKDIIRFDLGAERMSRGADAGRDGTGRPNSSLVAKLSGATGGQRNQSFSRCLADHEQDCWLPYPVDAHIHTHMHTCHGDIQRQGRRPRCQ